MGLHPLFGVAPPSRKSPDDLITTRGDIIRGSSSAAAERLAVGAADTFLGSDGTDPAYVAAATQAEQETGSATNKPVTPGRQHFHPSAAKGWARFQIDGTVDANFNVASIDDDGVGDWGVQWSTDFSGTSYAVAAVSIGANSDVHLVGSDGATGAATELWASDTAPTVSDPTTGMYVIAFGDQ